MKSYILDKKENHIHDESNSAYMPKTQPYIWKPCMQVAKPWYNLLQTYK